MKRVMIMIRTDLAAEACSRLSQTDLSGIQTEKQEKNGFVVEQIHITTDEAFYKTGKPKGTYITLYSDPFGEDSTDGELLAKEICSLLKTMIPKEGHVMVIGLGNREITPDALGPLVIDKTLATRHLTQEVIGQMGLGPLRCVSALAPGVLGQTGFEVQEILESISEDSSPCCILVIDALAAGDTNRLGTTIQLCDTGISPGSGVQNRRKEISKNTLGIPVIAIGVPTVIDAAALGESLIGQELSETELEKTQPQGNPMMVTPRDIDKLIEKAAHILSLAINMALQPNLKVGELLYLTA